MKATAFILVSSLGLAGAVGAGILNSMRGTIGDMEDQHLSATLVEAIASGDWQAIAVEAEKRTGQGSLPTIATLVRAYVSLHEGERSAATRHFLLAATSLSTSDCETLLTLGDRLHGIAPAQLLAAHAAARLGAVDRARAFVNRARRTKQDEALSRLVGEAVELRCGDACGTLSDGDELLDDARFDVEGLILQAIRFLQMGRGQDAQVLLSVALGKDPTWAVAWNTQGVVRAHGGDWTGAMDAFKRAYELAPDLDVARANWQLADKASKAPGTVVTATARNAPLRIVVTDYGINNYDTRMKMFDDFALAKSGPLVRDLPKAGEILIPMPSDRSFPVTRAERNELSHAIAEGIRRRIDGGGISSYEVRLVQNITTAGYFSGDRQEMVRAFGEIVNDGLSELKRGLQRDGRRVEMPGVFGSNGAFMFTETVAKARRTPIDSATLIDGRAYFGATVETCEILNNRCTIINTAGDIPSLPGMIANHDVSKKLQDRIPGTRVYWVDAKGIDLFGAKHLASMHGESEVNVKQYISGRNYTLPSTVAAVDVLSSAAGITTRKNTPFLTSTPGSDVCQEPGGVTVGPVDVRRGDGGRVTFSAGQRGGASFRLVLPIFGAEE